jgi:hypothetical protein
MQWAKRLMPVAMAAQFLPVFSPLRLHTDAIVYLLLASSAADGGGFLARGVPQKYPIGYPALIAALYADRRKRQQMGNAARLRAETRFSVGGMVAAYRALLGGESA